MKEKIKIISDGKTAEVFIDGEKVKCTEIDLHFSGYTKQEQTIKVSATWTKLHINGIQ